MALAPLPILNFTFIHMQSTLDRYLPTLIASLNASMALPSSSASPCSPYSSSIQSCSDAFYLPDNGMGSHMESIRTLSHPCCSSAPTAASCNNWQEKAALWRFVPSANTSSRPVMSLSALSFQGVNLASQPWAQRRGTSFTALMGGSLRPTEGAAGILQEKRFLTTNQVFISSYIFQENIFHTRY